jgi:pilus assembly protein CpaB
MQQMPASQAPIQPLTASYLVAARALTPGTLTRIDDFASKTVPTDKVPQNAILDTSEARAQLRGALVRVLVEEGAPVLKAEIMRPRDRGFLAAVLPANTRAVSIGVDPVTGVSGMIWPGDYVDVILTQDITPAGPGGHIVSSETILSNVQIIAVDQDIAQGMPPNGTSAGRIVSTVTVATTVDQAEKLAVATHLGHLSLAIRSIDDANAGNGAAPAVSGADVSTALARAGLGGGSHVEVIQGDRRDNVTFK